MADKQNPIACEPCRQKKCKCDRILPVCSQCSDATRCVYPESGKRGLPQGYVTHLEKRLADTERALYGTYTYLRTVSPRSFTISELPQPAPSRIAAISEWTQFPLRDPDDLERWWMEKSRVYGTAGGEALGSPGSVGLSSRKNDVPASIGRDSSVSHDHIHLHRRSVRPRDGLAEQLADLEPAVYF